MRLITCLITLGLLAGGARAQFDATEYFPLGVFNNWKLVQEDDETDQTFVKVTNVQLVDGVLRYTVVTPFFDTLDKVKLVMGQTDDGDWLLYKLGITTEQLEELDAKLINLDPPVKLGDTTTSFGTTFNTAVDSVLTLKVEIGPIKEKIDVDVTGTISSSFEDLLVDQETPAGTFPAAELIGWHFDLDLNFSSDDDDVDFDEDVQVDGFMKLHQGTGLVLATDPDSSLHVLAGAILPGTTVGDDFGPNGTVITDASVDTPGLFVLGGQTDTATTGGDFEISDIVLTQELNGNLTLSGTLSDGFLAEVPIEMKGKAKVNAVTGAGKLKLAGKIKGLTEKPLALKANAIITQDTTSLDIVYKSGPEIGGVMSLGIDPQVIESVDLAFNELVDADFKDGGSRVMGAEGVMTLNGDGGEMIDYPITLVEKRKVKEGFPDKHTYVITQTGLKKKVFVSKAVSEDADTYILLKFTGRLFGYKVKPLTLDDVTLTIVDDD